MANFFFNCFSQYSDGGTYRLQLSSRVDELSFLLAEKFTKIDNHVPNNLKVYPCASDYCNIQDYKNWYFIQ